MLELKLQNGRTINITQNNGKNIFLTNEEIDKINHLLNEDIKGYNSLPKHFAKSDKIKNEINKITNIIKKLE